MNRTLSFFGKCVRRKTRFSMKLLAAFLIVGMLAGSVSTSVYAADETAGGAEEVANVTETEDITEAQPGGTGTGEAAEQEQPEEAGTGEGTEEESAPEEVSTYATIEEFMAAMDAVGYADDIESQIAAVNNCLNIYDRLSPEDQAANVDAGAYIRSYADSINAGNPDEGIETTASRASYKGTVTLYGTPEAAIKSGPTYGSKVKIDLGTRTGQSWNNVSYTIPQVSEYFVLNDGWTIDYVSVAGNSSGNRQPGASFLLGMSGGSMVYYFKQTAVPKTFTLNYNAKGGSGAPNRQTATSTAASYNFTVSSTKPTLTGYEFLGWSTSSTATSSSYNGGDKINVTGTTTLYAVWKKQVTEQVTLTYDANGGINPPAAQTVDKGTQVTIKGEEQMTYTGYKFLGWSTDKNAVTADWAAGDKMKLSTNVTLYAVWEEIAQTAAYQVEWYDTEGNRIKAAETRNGTVGTKVAVTDADKVIENYTFDAGNNGNITESILSASGTVLKLYFTKNDVDNGNGISTEKTRASINGDASVTTAKVGDTIIWNIRVTNNSNMEKTVTLTEKLDGATLSKYTVELAPGASETVTATYVVIGNEDLVDGKLYNTVKATTGETGDKENSEDTDEGTDITITVTWKDGYTETPIKIETIKKGADYSDLYPADPTREGYIFDGWDDPEEDANGNITITAQWRQFPKLTGITKTLESISVNGDTPITDLSGLKAEKDDTIVLTYKIIVTGDKDAEYIVSDPDATPSSWTGTLGADGKAEITVTKTAKVTESDANLGKLTVTNKAYVKPGDNTDPVPGDPSYPKDPEKGHPSNEVETDIPVITIPTDDSKGISIEKTRIAINGDASVTTAKVGDTITWNIKVTNNSNAEKTVTLTEKLDGATLSKDSVTLASGKSETVTATYVVKDTDADKILVNTVIGKTSPDDPGKEGSDPGTEIEAEVYTVTYTDGVEGQEVFADQTTSGLKAGEDTPEFNGTPTREGYTFTGWTPAVAETVTGDAIYAAQWTENRGTDPVDPTPVDPTPENPTPEDPTPEDPTPAAPAPVVPAPVPVAPTVVPPTVPEEEPEVVMEENTPPLAEPEQPEEEEILIPAAEMEIGDEDLPLAEGQGRSWALVNFALMNLAIFESLMLLIGYFVKTKKASEEETEEEEKKLKKKGIMRLISLPVAIISIIAFCLTEDITLPTGFVDRWTILMVIIAVVQTVVVALSRKKEEDEEEKARA